jgi:hypothetical protein
MTVSYLFFLLIIPLAVKDPRVKTQRTRPREQHEQQKAVLSLPCHRLRMRRTRTGNCSAGRLLLSTNSSRSSELSERVLREPLLRAAALLRPQSKPFHLQSRQKCVGAFWGDAPKPRAQDFAPDALQKTAFQVFIMLEVLQESSSGLMTKTP